MRKGQKVSNLTTKQLLFDHMLLHKWYNDGGVTGWSKEDIVNDHVRIVVEILKRGLEHPETQGTLDEDSESFYSNSFSECAPLHFVQSLPDEIILHDEFVSLVGSFIEELHEPNDIDVIVKHDLPAVRELFEQIVTEKPLHMNESTGPSGQYVPIYELVLRKREYFQKFIYEYKIPLNSNISKQQYETRYQWAIEPEFGYFIEPKLHGENVFIHKDCSKVFVSGDVTLSESALEILSESGPEQYIVQAIVDSNGTVGIIDILRHSTTELADFTYKSRRAFLDKFKLIASPFVFKSPAFYVDAWETDEEALCAIMSLHPIEIICKDDHDMFYLDGTTPNWKIISIQNANKLQVGKQNFQALKANTGYGKFEFNSIDEAWMFWGKGFVAEGGVAVEKKFDGFRCIIHKTKDDRVFIFTEDRKRDLSINFPYTVEFLKTNFKGSEFILDSELVRNDSKGAPMPRQEVAYFIHGKQEKIADGWKVDDTYAVFNVFDCLYVNGKELINEPWTTRQAALKQVLETDSKNLHRVIPIIVNSEKEFKVAIKKQGAREGSEGAMLKHVKSTYPIDGRTASWAKYKHVLEVHLQVMRVIKKAKSTDTYMYDVGYLREGKLEQIGTTYSTNIKAKIGDILTVIPVQVIYNADSDKLTFMFPRVKELNTEIKTPDSLEQLMKVAEQPKGLNT